MRRRLGCTTGIPQHKAKQGFSVKTLKSIKPATPAIQNAPMINQTNKKDAKWGKYVLATKTIRKRQLIIRCGE